MFHFRSMILKTCSVPVPAASNIRCKDQHRTQTPPRLRRGGASATPRQGCVPVGAATDLEPLPSDSGSSCARPTAPTVLARRLGESRWPANLSPLNPVSGPTSRGGPETSSLAPGITRNQGPEPTSLTPDPGFRLPESSAGRRGEEPAPARHAYVCPRVREDPDLVKLVPSLFPAHVDLDSESRNRARRFVDPASTDPIMNFSTRGVGHPYLSSVTLSSHEPRAGEAHMPHGACDTQ